MRCILNLMLMLLCLISYAQGDAAITKKDSVQIDSLNPVTIPADTVAPEAKSKYPVYKLKAGIDVPLTLAATAWTLYGFKEIYNKPSSSPETIEALRYSDVNWFDRWAADIYSEKAEKASDYFFYGSMPLPLLLFLDKPIRKDAAKIAFLYWEAMSVTGIYYTGSAYIWDRYRPIAYNSAAPFHERINGNAKNSFLAGHVALVATSTFFMAKVYSDYHPDSKIKWVFYTVAAGATASTAYLRHRGGKHFPSDIIAGATLGTLTGILVPHFHKNRLINNPNLSITPFTGEANGLRMVYRL